MIPIPADSPLVKAGLTEECGHPKMDVPDNAPWFCYDPDNMERGFLDCTGHQLTDAGQKAIVALVEAAKEALDCIDRETWVPGSTWSRIRTALANIPTGRSEG